MMTNAISAPAEVRLTGTAVPTVPNDLLTSVVTVAKSAFGAAACSVLLLDEAAAELVFAAVAGEGADTLPGRCFPADRGIAGWVAATGEAMVVDELSGSKLFARDVAESTGYLPESIMAAQISWDGDCLGVIEVLDKTRHAGGEFGDLELLTLLAGHAALVLRGTRASQPPGEHAELAVSHLIRQLRGWDPPGRQAACQLLGALATLLGGQEC
jgi:hypothetical protein